MSITKLEIRKCVVECLAVEEDDVGVSSLVVRVTDGAFLGRRIGLTPVKPLCRPAIGCGFFVACEAQPRL